jgi:hypothetical protein
MILTNPLTYIVYFIDVYIGRFLCISYTVIIPIAFALSEPDLDSDGESSLQRMLLDIAREGESYEYVYL